MENNEQIENQKRLSERLAEKIEERSFWEKTKGLIISFVDLRASGKSLKEISKALNLHPRTLQIWDDHFAEEIAARRVVLIDAMLEAHKQGFIEQLEDLLIIKRNLIERFKNLNEGEATTRDLINLFEIVSKEIDKLIDTSLKLKKTDVN